MTDPRPQQPAFHAYYTPIPKINRPPAVSLLAFLGILVGSLLLFCDIIVMVTEALLLKTPDRSPMTGMPPLDPMVMKIGLANGAAGAVFGAVLLGACLAALSLRPASRKIIMLWSIAFVLWGVARTLGEIFYVAPINLEWVKTHRPDDPNFASGHMAAWIVPNAIGVLILYCILPALYLIFWNRPDVKEAMLNRRR